MGADLPTPEPRLRTPTVVLFPDTFTTYNDPVIGQAAVRVLEAAGYAVLLPRRPICCGRPMISKGLLDDAKALARQQLEWLAPYAEAGMPIIGLEPSCILTFRDEYPDLLDDPRATVLAKQSFLIDEFLMREAGEERLETLKSKLKATKQPVPDPNPKLPDSDPCVSSCCTATATRRRWSARRDALALLRMIPGSEVREVDTGCCGMAGSFGYEAEHYDDLAGDRRARAVPGRPRARARNRGGGDGRQLPPADRRWHRAARAAPGRGAGRCIGSGDKMTR